jgi:hypothetical protein
MGALGALGALVDALVDALTRTCAGCTRRELRVSPAGSAFPGSPDPSRAAAGPGWACVSAGGAAGR